MHIEIMLEPDRTPDEIAELAVLAEQAGITGLWVQNYASCRDPIVSLVPACLATSRIKLGVAVVSAYEMHPTKLANQMLTLNEFCGGRAALVVGGGGEWLVRLGIQPERRVRMVKESLEMIKGARPDRAFSYEGELFQIHGHQPAYATDTPPLIYTGANREQMLRVTAPLADGVMMSDMPHPRIDEAVAQIRAALTAADQPADGYRINNIWAWHIKPDAERGIREARREVLLRGLLERWYLASFMSPDDCDFIVEHKAAFYKAYHGRHDKIEGVPDRLVQSLLDNLTITGDLSALDEKLDALRAFATAGVNELAFRLHDDPDEAIAIIGEHVVPAFQ